MTNETSMVISVALIVIPLIFCAVVVLHFRADRRHTEERAAREERRRRETMVEHAIARRRREAERVSRTETSARQTG